MSDPSSTMSFFVTMTGVGADVIALEVVRRRLEDRVARALAGDLQAEISITGVGRVGDGEVGRVGACVDCGDRKRARKQPCPYVDDVLDQDRPALLWLCDPCAADRAGDI